MSDLFHYDNAIANRKITQRMRTIQHGKLVFVAFCGSGRSLDPIGAFSTAEEAWNAAASAINPGDCGVCEFVIGETNTERWYAQPASGDQPHV